MRLSAVLLFFLLGLSACHQEVETKIEKSHPISGLWKLHIMEIRDTLSGNWSEWRDGMQGYLLYDSNKNMALHLMAKGYEKTDLSFPNFTDTIPLEALQHLTNNYNYFAEYSLNLEDSIVQHRRISHSNPRDWDKVVQRKFSFKGDTLVLQPVETGLSNLRLKWIRKK